MLISSIEGYDRRVAVVDFAKHITGLDEREMLILGEEKVEDLIGKIFLEKIGKTVVELQKIGKEHAVFLLKVAYPNHINEIDMIFNEEEESESCQD